MIGTAAAVPEDSSPKKSKKKVRKNWPEPGIEPGTSRMPSYWYLGFGTLSENHTARPSGRMCLLKNSAPIKAYIDHACARPLQWVIRHFLASR